MSMIKYVIRRLLQLLPVLFGIITLTFILSRLMPGDPVTAHLGRSFTAAEYQAKMRELGLDRPMIEQYIFFLGNLFTGDWGTSSMYRGVPVWDLVLDRFFRTFDIALFAIILSSIVGLKTGVISATHRNKAKDTIFRGVALVGVSIPVFWMGMILQYFFANKYQFLDLFPATGYKTSGIGDPPSITHFRMIDCILAGDMRLLVDYVEHLILPILCLSFITLASITRQTRSSMLEVLEQDYVRTARAKGCKEKDVINTHARKNALIPTVTIIGLNFGGLLAGAVLTESTFNLHGLGELLIQAIQNTDYWVLNGIVFVSTLTFIIINLGIDILYGIIDPRIRY